jgi:hypothetical protein
MRRQITHSNLAYSVSKFHTRKHNATNVVNYFDCLRRNGPHATFMISWYLPQEWVRIMVEGCECNPNSEKSIIVLSVAECKGNKLIRLFL